MKKNILAFILLVSLMVSGTVFIPDCVFAVQTTLPNKYAIADTYVDSTNPATSNGNATLLNVLYNTDTEPDQEKRIFLKFDLSDIPDDVEIVSATLNIHGSVSTNNRYLSVYRVNDDTWIEGTSSTTGINWNTQPAYNSTPEATILLDVGTTRTWQPALNVTAYVQQQKAAYDNNTISLMLKYATKVGTTFNMDSRETGSKPYLQIVTQPKIPPYRVSQAVFQSNGETITKLIPGSLNSQVQITNDGNTPLQALVIAAAYKGDLLCDIASAPVTVPATGSLETYSVGLNIPDNSYTVKTYVWTDSQGMQPLAYPVSIDKDGKQTNSSEWKVAYKILNSTTANAQENRDTCRVTVNGAVYTQKTEEITLLVRDSNDIIRYVAQNTSQNDGSYQFDFSLPDPNELEGKQYNIIVGSWDTPQVKQATTVIKYFGTVSTNAVKNALKQSTAEIVSQMLDQQHPVLIQNAINLKDFLQLDPNTYNVYANLYNKQPVVAVLAGKDFTTVASIVTAFNNAVTDEKNYERIMNDFNFTEANNMAQMLNRNNDILELDLTNPYGYQMLLDNKAAGKSDTVNKIYTALVQGKPYTQASQIIAIFNMETALQSVNDATLFQMGEVLNAHQQNLDITLAGDYKKLNEGQLEQFHKAMVLKDFADKNELSTFFNKTIADILAVKPSGSGGGGSGGSGRSTVFTTSPVVLPTPSPSAAPIFHDIDQASWAKDSIEALAAKGYVEGTAEGIFQPNISITREQFIKILINAMKLLDTSATTNFKDVEQGAWYYPYIASAQKAGICSGINNDEFGINREITRQEMAELSYRASKYVGAKLPTISAASVFEDSSDIADYAQQSINVMQQANIIKGIDGNRFAPMESTTRAMAVKVIYELMKYIP